MRRFLQELARSVFSEIEMISEFRGNSHIVSFEDSLIVEDTESIGWDILIRMELLTSLAAVLADRSMPQEEVVKLGIHMCRALELCGLKKIVHRDIKPGNIFVSPYGDYKLGDFGIARYIESTSSGLSKKGTYTYMAPEIFRYESYGASADIYSLGIVMYSLLNQNRTPFLPDFPEPILPGDREDALHARVTNRPVPALRGVSPELNRIVLKACAYERQDRFASPAEMRERLEALARSMEKKAEAAEGAAKEADSKGIEGKGMDPKETADTKETPDTKEPEAGGPGRPVAGGQEAGRRKKLFRIGAAAAAALVLGAVLGSFFLLGGNDSGDGQTGPPGQTQQESQQEPRSEPQPEPVADPTLLVPGPAGTDLPQSLQVRNPNWLFVYGRAVWTADGSVRVVADGEEGIWTNIGSRAPGAVSASVLSPVSGLEIAEVLNQEGTDGYILVPVDSGGQWTLEVRAAGSAAVLASTPWVDGQRLGVGYADGTVFFVSGAMSWSAEMSGAYQVDICFQAGATRIRDVQVGKWPLPLFSASAAVVEG
jgi:hypothetical protein